MKKVLAISAFAILGVAALSSCKKEYSCMKNGVELTKCADCSSAQKTSFEAACQTLGGTVEKK